MAALLGTLLVPSPADAATRLPCSKKGSATLAASEHARVYFKADTTYACLYEHDRPLFLARDNPASDNYEFLSQIRLSGKYLGAFEITQDRHGRDGRVLSFDLAARRAVHVSSVFGVTGHGTGRDDYVHDLELGPHGSIAFILGPSIRLDGTPTSGSDYQVLKLDGPPRCPGCPAANPTVLDAARDVDRRSLAASGSTVYWTRANTPHSAALDSPQQGDPPSRTGQSDSKCSLKGSKTLAGNTHVRIFEKDFAQEDSLRPQRIYTCRYSRNKRMLLRETEHGGEEINFLQARIEGRFAGIAYASIVGTVADLTVASFDSKLGRLVQRDDGMLLGAPGQCCGALPDMEMGATGALTYIYQPPELFQSEPGPYQVRRLQGPGCPRSCPKPQVLDSGREMDPDSLALSASIVYWTKGGQPYSAPLN